MTRSDREKLRQLAKNYEAMRLKRKEIAKLLGVSASTISLMLGRMHSREVKCEHCGRVHWCSPRRRVQ